MRVLIIGGVYARSIWPGVKYGWETFAGNCWYDINEPEINCFKMPKPTGFKKHMCSGVATETSQLHYKDITFICNRSEANLKQPRRASEPVENP